MKQTKRCVRCLKAKAVLYYGHIRKGRTILFAGWCARCYRNPAFVGHWRREMGSEEAKA